MPLRSVVIEDGELRTLEHVVPIRYVGDAMPVCELCNLPLERRPSGRIETDWHGYGECVSMPDDFLTNLFPIGDLS